MVNSVIIQVFLVLGLPTALRLPFFRRSKAILGNLAILELLILGNLRKLSLGDLRKLSLGDLRSRSRRRPSLEKDYLYLTFQWFEPRNKVC